MSHQNAESIDVLTSEDWYSFREVQSYLAHHRSKPVPRSTLHRWIKSLCMETVDGFYDPQDLPYLVRLSNWLERGGHVQSFAQIISRELQNNGN
jgi:hypothetical protein